MKVQRPSPSSPGPGEKESGKSPDVVQHLTGERVEDKICEGYIQYAQKYRSHGPTSFPFWKVSRAGGCNGHRVAESQKTSHDISQRGWRKYGRMPTKLDIDTGDRTTTFKDRSLLNVSLVPRAKVSGEWSKTEEVWAESGVLTAGLAGSLEDGLEVPLASILSREVAWSS